MPERFRAYMTTDEEISMKKRNNWNLLEQLDRLPIEDTEYSQQINQKISGIFLRLLLVILILLFAASVLKLIPSAYLLQFWAGGLGVALGVRYILSYYYGTVFTVYSHMAGREEKAIKRKKDQAFFLTILCEALLFHIAFHSLFGTSTLVLLTWLIVWYLIYTVAFHFYAKAHPFTEPAAVDQTTAAQATPELTAGGQEAQAASTSSDADAGADCNGDSGADADRSESE